MKLHLLFAFLLLSFTAAAQSDGGKSVYVLLAPAGADTGLEVRCAMRIRLVHLEEGELVGYRMKDQAFLLKARSEEAASALQTSLHNSFRDAVVKKLYLSSYINEGFREVKKTITRQDPTFPLHYDTGDNLLDSRSYRIEKLDWIANHPAAEEGDIPGGVIKQPTQQQKQ